MHIYMDQIRLIECLATGFKCHFLQLEGKTKFKVPNLLLITFLYIQQ